MNVLRAACVAAALAVVAASGGADAQSSVLRVAQGAASRDLAVDVNRAVVLEAAEPFAEVSVANPGIADVAALSNRTIYVLGKQPGRTTLTLLGAGGRLIANLTIRVSPDLAELKTRLREILPGEPIEVRAANNGIVLSGTVSGVAKLARAMELAERYAPGRVSNMMNVGGTQQVMLKVRFAEVQRSASKELGFNWALGFTAGNFGLNTNTGDYIGGVNVPGRPVPGGSGGAGLSTSYTPSGSPDGLVRLGFAAGGFVANLAIDAMESKGLARTLAEPNLVALSGDNATFLAGGNYPIPVRSDDGISVEYRPFGVSLSFTPTVVDDDLINLELEAESSAIDNSIVVQSAGFTYNGFSTRRSKTTIELRDGESFAIAGLLQDDFIDNANQIPWLGDVPVLGTLFRSSDYQRRQTELVIIVTAHLVTPTAGEALSLPTDRIAIPDESELFLFGKLEGPAGAVAAGGFEGAYGYVME
ncbi:type II and III secretion system protein family protein [Oceanicella actignis]|uniref:Pilus assembly protein CpaC n=1 Tax=Oceanicella actignis TaxID=1189325 RepID=A0A1M7TKF2_9RHOB|nr:type II and III secretion system protein family protein [Oceanicella actignis]TYO88215.1 pilus assembly protein CpaC [Oceanicella actignis]SET67703.1 pilus assembly protein CpaC [Oceanicella actignis]SHN71093.1 pilus assembly protein CpaC [Oceanicella actignis]